MFPDKYRPYNFSNCQRSTTVNEDQRSVIAKCCVVPSRNVYGGERWQRYQMTAMGGEFSAQHRRSKRRSLSLVKNTTLVGLPTPHSSISSLPLFPPYGAGAPLFPPCPFISSSFPLLLFSFLHWLYLFSSFVHPFPFYQNSHTPFPGRRS